MADSKRRDSGSKLEDIFERQLRQAGITGWVREHCFAKEIGRSWSFDFAFPALKLAVEIEGGTNGKSRHTSPEGYREDCHKYNCASLLGWRLLRGDAIMLRHFHLLCVVKDALLERPPSLIARSTRKNGRTKRIYSLPADFDPWTPLISRLHLSPPTLSTGPTSFGPESDEPL